MKANSLEQLLEHIDNLINYSDLYDLYSNNCLIKAEKYHIDQVAKLYKELI